MKYIYSILFVIVFSLPTFSQVKYVVIDSIQITGNNRTKEYILLNEMDIEVGDTILFNNLGIRFEKNKNRILGTKLFVNIDFNLKKLNTETGHSNLVVEVDESWYIYPKIILELTDRSFNEWYYQHDASLKRINYGLGLTYANLSGNKDVLELMFQRGITKKFEIKYSRPFWNKDCNIGFVFDVFYKYSKELAYDTKYNKLIFVKDDDKNIFKQYRISSSYTYRPKIYDTQTINFNYFNTSIDSIVLKNYNSDFLSGRTQQKYFLLSYSYFRDKRDYQLYPKGGFLLGGTIEKLGLGIFDDIDQLNLYFSYEKYFLINRNFISTYIFKSKYKLLGEESPYFNNKAIGYEENLLHGYDLYVIDGEDFAFFKTAQKFNLFDGSISMPTMVSLKQFKDIPYEFYLSINYDVGYVNNNVNFVENNFNNRFLYGYGVGIDVLAYNSLFSIDYSLNHIGDSGVFFYYKNEF